MLHGFPSANVHPHVASKNLLQDSNSDAISASHRFCLAMKALVIVDFLGVDEHAADVCGVHMASGVAVLALVDGNVDSTSSSESGSTGNSIIPVNLLMNHVLIFV